MLSTTKAYADATSLPNNINTKSRMMMPSLTSASTCAQLVRIWKAAWSSKSHSQTCNGIGNGRLFELSSNKICIRNNMKTYNYILYNDENSCATAVKKKWTST